MQSLNCCSFVKTGEKYAPQYWKHCIDCFSSYDEGACLTCISTCHQGHTLGPLKYGNFFCDCGSEKTKCVMRKFPMPIFEPRVIQPIQPIQPIHPTKIQPTVFKKTSMDLTPIKIQPITPRISGGKIVNFSNMSRFANIVNTSGKKLSNMMNKDTIFSPASIAFALSLIHLGAINQTNDELTSFFGDKLEITDLLSVYNVLNNNGIKTSNMLVLRLQNNVLESYKNEVGQIAQISNQDFSYPDKVANVANTYIEQNTNGLIKKCVDPKSINNDIELLLINTIYFKGTWKKKFEPQNTKQCIFYGFTDISNISLMSQNDDFMYFEDNEKQVVEMGYTFQSNEFSQSTYSMGIILPKNNTLIDFDLSHVDKMYSENIDLSIPKFTHKKKMELKPFMEKCGVKTLFTKEAQLQKMSSSRTLFVSSIIHETIMIVDEEGTEAAAATVVTCTNECATIKKKPKVFRADHAFKYYIRHIPTNTILFMGQYLGTSV